MAKPKVKSKNKDQHYLPCVFLKHFSHNEHKNRNAEVLLCRIGKDRVPQQLVPVQSQCAGSFTYSRNTVYEKDFWDPHENHWINIVKRIRAHQNAGEPLKKIDILFALVILLCRNVAFTYDKEHYPDRLTAVEAAIAQVMTKLGETDVAAKTYKPYGRWGIVTIRAQSPVLIAGDNPVVTFGDRAEIAGDLNRVCFGCPIDSRNWIILFDERYWVPPEKPVEEADDLPHLLNLVQALNSNGLLFFPAVMSPNVRWYSRQVALEYARGKALGVKAPVYEIKKSSVRIALFDFKEYQRFLPKRREQPLEAMTHEEAAE